MVLTFVTQDDLKEEKYHNQYEKSMYLLNENRTHIINMNTPDLIV